MNYTNKIEQLRTQGFSYGRPTGNSMLPRVQSGEKLLFLRQETYKIDDVVLCKVKGSYLVHLVIGIGQRGYQIANNKGHVNGWTHTIYGKAFGTPQQK